MRRTLVLFAITLGAHPALAQWVPTTSTSTSTSTSTIAAPAIAPSRPLIRGLRINPGVMTIGAARIPDRGWNYVLGYHVRLDLVLPGRLALGSELGIVAIPSDDTGTSSDTPEWGAVTVAEHLVYQSTARTRLAIAAGIALPGYAPALSAAIHLRASCLSDSGGPCYWLQARADLIGGVPVIALALQLGL